MLCAVDSSVLTCDIDLFLADGGVWAVTGIRVFRAGHSKPPSMMTAPVNCTILDAVENDHSITRNNERRSILRRKIHKSKEIVQIGHVRL